MSRAPYPPEFDQPVGCDVCGKDVDECGCPECPVCRVTGDPDCARLGHFDGDHDGVCPTCNGYGEGGYDTPLGSTVSECPDCGGTGQA